MVVFHHVLDAKSLDRAGRLRVASVVRPGQAGQDETEALTLWLKNPHITAVEAGKKVGCSHVSAAAILKALRAVKVTPVGPAASVDKSGSSASESA